MISCDLNYFMKLGSCLTLIVGSMCSAIDVSFCRQLVKTVFIYSTLLN